ncbi:ubiquinone biosynthesis hydroxylase [Ochrobactrum sp. RH2CCR150]|uniref:ubiquinone biosynthesis hydroxylase n=1 Tax=Ochrobactrum sp. RH2CCR150 TaxID=2587044 RepID=UPI0015FC9B23|nr:2-octaprenyl-6-methoxyphenol hydroxylase [Ochrobactrum sp. RH2CCR150]
MAAKSKQTSTSNTDLLIAGGGYVGLVTAVAVKSAAPHLSVTVVDGAPAGAWRTDPRASSIAAAASRMLDKLGCWQEILPEAQPITEMVITDSRVSDPVRPVFLTFSGDVDPGEPFAHMVENRVLNTALHNKADALGITFLEATSVNGFETKPETVAVSLSDGNTIETRLLIAADGARSRLRDQAGIKTVNWDYGQSGIVCNVSHEKPHGGRADEHFLPAGPFAILPLKGNRSSLVWTERTADADRLIREDDFVFEAELEQRFGHRLGALHVEGPRRAFPLGLTLAREFVKPRFALVGDAAHRIHPIAGQGLNLGFRDAAAIAEVIVETDRLGLDIGSFAALERYQSWRRFDTVQMGVTTDVLTKLFSNDNPAIRSIRDIGLGLVDRVPSLKSFFIKQAAGLSGETPRLLKGQSI